MATAPKNRNRLGRGLSSLLSLSSLPVEREIAPSDNSSAPPTSVLPAVSREIAASALPDTPSPEVTRPTIHAATTPDTPISSDFVSASSSQVIQIPLGQIRPNPYQPRRDFDPDSLKDLAASLAQDGVIQPILVRSTPTGMELIAGERRWRAAKIAGLDRIPAIVRSLDSAQQAQIALVENIQRDDLNPIERAVGYATLMQQLGLTQAELATRLGLDRTGIAHHVRLLDLTEPVRQMVRDGRLSLGHAKLLAGVPDILQQQQLAETALSQDLTVRGLERLIKYPPTDSKPVPPVSAVSPHIQSVERDLTSALGMRVQLRSRGKKGRVVIHYASLDEFDTLIERLGVKLGD